MENDSLSKCNICSCDFSLDGEGGIDGRVKPCIDDATVALDPLGKDAEASLELDLCLE